MVAASNPYLYFNGNCRQAMTFYRGVFGVDGVFTTFGEMPPDQMPDGVDPDGVMHCELHVPGFILMAGDAPPQMAWSAGHNFTLSLTCSSIEEMDSLFAALSDGGSVMTPVHDAFWGDRIGILRDRFGISWMLSFR